MKLTQEQEDKLDDAILEALESSDKAGSNLVDWLHFRKKFPPEVYELTDERNLVERRCKWLSKHGFIEPHFYYWRIIE
jgi:hypothetical protein